MNSSGTISYSNTANSGNNTYVFKSKPTITNAALPSTVLTSGTIAIGKVTISADSAGSVSWRKLVWNVSTSSPSTGQYVVSAPALYDAADESTTLSGVTVTLNQTASAASTFNITASSSAASSDQSIGAGQSKTYVLKATVTGTIVAGASINSTIAASSTSRTAPNTAQVGSVRYPSFLWSDSSALSHSETTSDWMDDYLIKNIPTDSQTVKL